MVKHWYNRHTTYAYEQLINAQNDGEDISIMWDTDAKDNDLFVEWDIIDPNNPKKMMYNVWVPVHAVGTIENEKETTDIYGKDCDLKKNLFSDLKKDLSQAKNQNEISSLIKEYNSYLEDIELDYPSTIPTYRFAMQDGELITTI